jgi:Bardet-Biedl syndrome 9 protein
LLSFVYKFQIGFCTQGWEETVDAAIAYLLKTCLSKSSKEQALNLSSQLNIPKDTSRLKKHITLLCDRLAKGGRLCVSTDAAAPQAMVVPGKIPA